MTRAVVFDGFTRLYNQNLGQIADFARPFSCGTLSYWYRSHFPDDAAILVGSSYLLGEVLQVMHMPDAGGGLVYPQVNLSASQIRGNGAKVTLLGRDPLPYDFFWHHVIYAWNTNTSPFLSKLLVDGVPNPLINLWPPRDPDSGLRISIPFEIDYSITDNWRIGGQGPQPPAGPFTGDVAELYFQAMTVYVDPELTPIAIVSDPFAAHALSIAGVGFFNPLSTKPFAPRGTAMELGPLGLHGTGMLSLRIPQVYCSDDQSTFARPRVHYRHRRPPGRFSL